MHPQPNPRIRLDSITEVSHSLGAATYRDDLPIRPCTLQYPQILRNCVARVSSTCFNDCFNDGALVEGLELGDCPAFETLTSVTLMSDARGRGAQDLALLKSLPRNIARLKIVYGHHGWRDDAGIAKGILQIDWAVLSDTIVPHGRIECLESGVVRFNQLSNIAPLAKNGVACATILEKLPKKLRRIVRFV